MASSAGSISFLCGLADDENEEGSCRMKMIAEFPLGLHNVKKLINYIKSEFFFLFK